jgi:predicted GNAT family acetyltransferase
VTILRPDLRRAGPALPLADSPSARAAVARLVDADPVVNVVVAARLTAAGSLLPTRLGGQLIGVRGPGGLAGACFAGGNLLTIGGDPDSWRALGGYLAAEPRLCSSIVGRADAVRAVWHEVRAAWGPSRETRWSQPLLVLDSTPAVEPDPAVHRATHAELDRYLAAAATMFTEELGVSPHVSPGTEAFRARIGHLIDRGHAFMSADFRGQVVFKAEIAAVSRATAQVQGVWVRPDLRGRGIGTAGLAAVFRAALQLAPTVSLYVNDYNVAAQTMYQRLGMRSHAVLATVLLP